MASNPAAKVNHDGLFGDSVSTLAQTDPELIEYFDNFAFDEIDADAARLDPTLDRHLQVMVQLAAILAAGGLAEFRVMATVALAHGGVSPVELKEIVYQSIAYVGMARAYDFLHAVNGVLTDAGVELPLPGQSASTPLTRLEYGKTVQGHIIGDGAVAARLSETPADEVHFQRYLATNCFGDTVGRRGVDLQVRELLTFSMLVALGGADAQVRGHVNGNLMVGNTREKLLAVLTVWCRSSATRAPSTASPLSTTSPAEPLDALNEEEHDMEYRLLGRTGVSVSPLCLGTMMFGPWGNDDRADAIRVIRRALDAGINFVDTADVYSAGVSEEIVGDALQGRRDDVVLATKFFMPMDDRPNHGGGSRKWIMQAVENSLRRLRTDYIDLYQVHRPSPTTDVEETLGALTDLVRQGKVRYIGSSSYAASQIVEAQWASRERSLARFVTEQPPYSILVRGIEEDVLPTTQRYGMGTLVYSPLSGGWLTGRWRKNAPGAPTSAARPSARFDMSTPANQRKLDVVEELALLAEKAGLTLIELALAWAIDHPGVTSAIIGPRTMEQLESQLPAADVTLSTEILDRIDELVAPGVTLNADDNSYGAAELTPLARRR